jgi:hypothetical protein
MIQHSFIQDSMNRCNIKRNVRQTLGISDMGTIPRKSTKQLERNKEKSTNLKTWRVLDHGPCSPDPRAG